MGNLGNRIGNALWSPVGNLIAGFPAAYQFASSSSDSPTLSSLTINAAGDELTAAYTGAVADYEDITLTASGGAVTATASSGAGTANHVFSLSRVVYAWETVTATGDTFTDEEVTGGAEFETLTLPDTFPVTLRRNDTEYSIAETGADWLADHTGATHYLSESGDDTTGDGTSGTPWRTISKAIAEATALDRVSMSPGIYAAPGSVTKSLAFLAPSGGVFIGAFDDLSTAQIDPAADAVRWNVDNIGGVLWAGLVRRDGTNVAGVKATAWSPVSADGTAYQNLGIMAIQAAGSSANVALGTAESLPDLVAADAVYMWKQDSTTNLTFPTGVGAYIGPGIIIANYHASAALLCTGTGTVVLDGCEVYGSAGQTVWCQDSGTLISFDTRVAGSPEDNIDYQDTAIGVEVGVTSCWPGSALADNASTCHEDSKVLRVGGTYRGGSRTVHDVHDSHAYVFSCSIGDPLFEDKDCLLNGSSITSPETVQLDYGDITFLDTFAQGDLTNTVFDGEATITNTELADPWPY